MFWTDDNLGSQLYLDGVVTVLDGKYGSQVLDFNINIGGKKDLIKLE